jgi:hypothetical protein
MGGLAVASEMAKFYRAQLPRQLSAFYSRHFYKINKWPTKDEWSTHSNPQNFKNILSGVFGF